MCHRCDEVISVLLDESGQPVVEPKGFGMNTGRYSRCSNDELHVFRLGFGLFASA